MSAALLGGCHKSAQNAEQAAPHAAADDQPAGEASAAGIELKADEIEKMGIVTTAAKAMMHIPQASGFGTVDCPRNHCAGGRGSCHCGGHRTPEPLRIGARAEVGGHTRSHAC